MKKRLFGKKPRHRSRGWSRRGSSTMEYDLPFLTLTDFPSNWPDGSAVSVVKPYLDLDRFEGYIELTYYGQPILTHKLGDFIIDYWCYLVEALGWSMYEQKYSSSGTAFLAVNWQDVISGKVLRVDLVQKDEVMFLSG